MRWEYKIVDVPLDTMGTVTYLPQELAVAKRFSEWGEEGWELVRVEPILRGGWFFFGFGSATRTASLVAFFRRAKA